MLEQVWVPALAGIGAGLGVAMPLGAIGALLLREGLVNGFRVAAAGATGVAVVDTAYCALATVAGAALAPLLRRHEPIFLAVSGALLVAVGLLQLRTALRQRGSTSGTAAAVEPSTARAAFLKFLGLTAINPMTLVYFVALAGAVTTRSDTWIAPIVFIAAVGAASWAWQLLLARAGSFLGGSLGPRATELVSVVGSLVVVGLGATIVLAGSL